VSGTFDWLKAIQLKPRFFFAFMVLGLLILFLPSRLSVFLGIDCIVTQFRPWIGLATVAAFCLWLVQMFPILRAARLRKRDREAAVAHLLTLSTQEWFILAYCLYRGQRTIYLPLTDQAAHSLCDKGLLCAAGGTGNILDWPFTIPDFVWEHLELFRGCYPLIADLEDPRFQEAVRAYEGRQAWRRP